MPELTLLHSDDEASMAASPSLSLSFSFSEMLPPSEPHAALMALVYIEQSRESKRSFVSSWELTAGGSLE